MPKTPQQRFDEAYISSTEVCAKLGVTRTAVLQARRNGWLPEPICVNNSALFIWEREFIQPYIERWRMRMKHRKQEASLA